jgi:signal transduction histidine kinase
VDASTVQAKGVIGRQALRDAAPALWTAAGYFIAAEIDAAIALSRLPVPQFQLGGAVLLASLLASPGRIWLPILLAIVPAHMLAQLHQGIPPAASMAWLAGAYGQALLGAGGLVFLLRERVRFDILHHVAVFIGWCGLLAPALMALLQMAMLRGAGVQDGANRIDWQAQVLASAAAALVLVPPVLNRPAAAFHHLLGATCRRQLEAAVLVVMLFAIGALGMYGKGSPAQFAALLACAPLPLLFWTVMRFGPFGTECVFLLFAALVVAATAAGAGPFAPERGAGGVLLPLFLSSLAAPLLLLSASLRERRGTLAALCAEQARLGEALLAERERAERLARERTDCVEAAQGQRVQLAHLTRVVALGELSGALAHELNQPLAAILTNAQAARRFLSKPGADLGELRAILDDIVEEDKRAGEVIRRLRALFRKGEVVRGPVELGRLVRESLELARARLAARNVGVRLALEDGVVAYADRVQLQQVLLNLIVNASDALQSTPPARRQLRLACATMDGGAATITVADSGPGIAPDAIGKVFEPFFTTKEEGLGIGLAISRTIIAQHGGRIDADNIPSGGCRFRISLPAYLGRTG